MFREVFTSVKTDNSIPFISLLCSFTISDRSVIINIKRFNIFKLCIGEIMRHLALFKRTNKTERNETFLNIIIRHQVRCGISMSSETFLKFLRFTDVIKRSNASIKSCQCIETAYLGFSLRQRFTKCLEFSPFYSKNFNSHLSHSLAGHLVIVNQKLKVNYAC